MLQVGTLVESCSCCLQSPLLAMHGPPQEEVVHQDIPPAYKQAAVTPRTPLKIGTTTSAKRLKPVSAIDAAEEEMPVALTSRPGVSQVNPPPLNP